jgi:hypothetical protein
MGITIDDFMKDANDLQKQLLFDLVELGDKEHNLCEEYNNKVDSLNNISKTLNPFKDGQYTKIIKEDAEDLLLINTKDGRSKLKEIKSEMKDLYIKSIEFGMGDLGIIQRNYEHYVREPITNQ